MPAEYKLSMDLFCRPPPFYVDNKYASLVPVNQILLFEIVLHKAIPEYLNISAGKYSLEDPCDEKSMEQERELRMAELFRVCCYGPGIEQRAAKLIHCFNGLTKKTCQLPMAGCSHRVMLDGVN